MADAALRGDVWVAAAAAAIEKRSHPVSDGKIRE
jgi:hypothetical protein